MRWGKSRFKTSALFCPFVKDVQNIRIYPPCVDSSWSKATLTLSLEAAATEQRKYLYSFSTSTDHPFPSISRRCDSCPCVLVPQPNWAHKPPEQLLFEVSNRTTETSVPVSLLSCHAETERSLAFFSKSAPQSSLSTWISADADGSPARASTNYIRVRKLVERFQISRCEGVAGVPVLNEMRA